MKLLSIGIQNFRSFREKQVFEFPDGPGLYLVKGNNKVEPALASNGSGKSTLWDAVCWALYGKTVRGVSSHHVEAWDLASVRYGFPKVEVHLRLVDATGRTRDIVRCRKPNRLTVNGVNSTQDQIDRLVGIDYDQFLYVCVAGQFGTAFPDLKPAARLSLLTQVLHLEEWEDRAGKARAATRHLEALVRDLEQQADRGESAILTLKETRQSMRDDVDRWEQRRAEQLAEIRKRLKELEPSVVGFKEKMTQAMAGLAGVSKHQENVQKDLDSVSASIRDVSKHIMKLEAEINSKKKMISALEKQGAEIEELQDAECPTCTTRLTGRDVDRALGVVDDRVTREEKRLQGLERSLRDQRAKLKTYRSRREELEVIHTREQKRISEYTGAYDDAERQRERVVREIEQLRTQRDDLKDSVNPVQAHIESIASKIQGRELDLVGVYEELDSSIRELENVKPWADLFKHLRLWVVDTALEELSMYANECLHELGLGSWAISFSVERETRSGSVSRGFEIKISNDTAPDGVPWESWSGGETQRLRIACAVGLAMLIKNRMPGAPEWEVWDEPTAHLNPGGVSDLVRFMAERAEHSQTWLVDHRTIDSGLFDGQLLVTKTEEGSSFEFTRTK